MYIYIYMISCWLVRMYFSVVLVVLLGVCLDISLICSHVNGNDISDDNGFDF